MKNSTWIGTIFTTVSIWMGHVFFNLVYEWGMGWGLGTPAARPYPKSQMKASYTPPPPLCRQVIFCCFERKSRKYRGVKIVCRWSFVCFLTYLSWIRSMLHISLQKITTVVYTYKTIISIIDKSCQFITLSNM